MSALPSAVIYFGTFLAIGWLSKRLLRRFMARHGEHLDEVQAQYGASGKKGSSFLLGVWRK